VKRKKGSAGRAAAERSIEEQESNALLEWSISVGVI